MFRLACFFNFLTQLMFMHSLHKRLECEIILIQYTRFVIQSQSFIVADYGPRVCYIVFEIWWNMIIRNKKTVADNPWWIGFKFPTHSSGVVIVWLHSRGIDDPLLLSIHATIHIRRSWYSSELAVLLTEDHRCPLRYPYYWIDLHPRGENLVQYCRWTPWNGIYVIVWRVTSGMYGLKTFFCLNSSWFRWFFIKLSHLKTKLLPICSVSWVNLANVISSRLCPPKNGLLMCAYLREGYLLTCSCISLRHGHFWNVRMR